MAPPPASDSSPLDPRPVSSDVPLIPDVVGASEPAPPRLSLHQLERNVRCRAQTPVLKKKRSRSLMALLLMGQVLVRLLQGRFHRRNLMEHLANVGPGSLRSVIMINGCAGMIFTVQTARELGRYGATDSVGGAFALAFCRELAPVLTAGVVAGQVGAAFAAELGTMRVTEQIDALKMMRTDPVDYLIVPRVVATLTMLPLLTMFAIVVGLLGGTAVALLAYGQPPNIFLESVRQLLELKDLLAVVLKSMVFALIIATLGCSFGLTTTGGAKGVGESATAAVVSIWVGIFMADFVMSILLFGLVDL